MARVSRPRLVPLGSLTFLLATLIACGGATATPSASTAPTTTPTAATTATAIATDTAAATATPTDAATATATTGPTTVPTVKAVYAIVDLGVIDGVAENVRIGVNNSANVAGITFYYHSGAKTTIKPAPGQTTVNAFSLNASNLIVGQGCATDCHATVWTAPATGRDLGTLGGDSSAAAQANSAGVVVGTSDTPGNATTHAFRQQGVAAMKDLNTLVVSGPALELREAWGINSSGTVVGWGGDNGAPYAFVLTAAGVLTKIGPAAMPNAMAADINDAGFVTGRASDGANTVGFIYKGGSYTVMPVLKNYQLTHPYAINSANRVVGCARNMEDDTLVHAFTFIGGKTTDLNALIPGGTAWTLECATDVSDNGIIVGTGLLGTKEHAFMLVPG